MSRGLDNLILDTDSYKYSHPDQYPLGIKHISSYIESRGGRWPETVFFGLQYFLKRYLSKPITLEDVDEALDYCASHGVPFHYKGWKRIVTVHGGMLPVLIQAVPEGMVIPTNNVLVQIMNTDPDCFWLTSFLETALLRVWYGTTVATQSFMIKRIINRNLEQTGDIEEDLFKLHDFGSRGISCREQGGIGGAAHLVNYLGSDNVGGVIVARDYYNESMAGFSIPAAEHSTICSWGGPECEIDAFKNMIDKFGGKYPIIAVVSDSWNFWDAIENKWPSLKDSIISSGSTIVIRPDSGNPLQVVPDGLEILMSKFGHITNSKGYKVLPSYIRMIQGDGVDEQSIKNILEELKRRGISGDNITFGMGGALLQRLDRDTCKFAMKASAKFVDGEWQDIFKDPIDDRGKKSKPGRLQLLQKEDGTFITEREGRAVCDGDKILQTVFRDGELLIDQTLAEIRTRASSSLGV